MSVIRHVIQVSDIGICVSVISHVLQVSDIGICVSGVSMLPLGVYNKPCITGK